MQRERRRRRNKGAKNLLKTPLKPVLKSSILTHASEDQMHAWGLGMHPPPRKPETFAKKSHRRSPNKRTNHTS
jgi:hypothetical protein